MADKSDSIQSPRLGVLDFEKQHEFVKPVKKINEGQDVSHFLTSKAYSDICAFVLQLDLAVCPRIDNNGQVQTFELGDESVIMPDLVERLQAMLKAIEAMIDEVPPDTGPRRFGNISFRRWHELFDVRVMSIMADYLPEEVLKAGTGDVKAEEELASYLIGGFGSGQRLDYGTGHELSFLAFLACLWKLSYFSRPDMPQDGRVERSIVLGVFEPYLNVIRKLVLTYTLEPAGSHGVWGLDDHFFLSYVFGSAQLCPPIPSFSSPMPTEGSLPSAPAVSDVAKKNIVDKERKTNMYFSAIGFINDVKTGPFWEHSPILYDISGIKAGWGKVNKGMLKMFNAEVLGKFPVVQHFYFGSLFSWKTDPAAAAAPKPTVHMANQPTSTSISVEGNIAGAPTARPNVQEGKKAPWAGAATAAPWAKPASAPGSQMPMTTAPWAKPEAGGGSTTSAGGMPPTRAPWASGSNAHLPKR